MHNQLRLIPLAAPVAAFTAGILIYLFSSANIPVFYFMGMLGIAGLTGFIFRYSKTAFSVIGLPCFLVAGFAFTGINDPKLYPDFFTPRADQPDTVLVKISEPIEEKENSIKAIGKILYTYDNREQIRVQGMLLLYLEKNKPDFEMGDTLLLSSYINEVEAPKNPKEFDYKSYLAGKHIYYRAFVKADDVKTVSQQPGFSIKRLSHKVRNFFLERLSLRIKNPDDFAVAAALTLGYRNELSPEVRSDFADAGAMHILAVSGLHVGVIFGLLKFIFAGLPHFKYRRKIEGYLILFSLWGYAFITGLSPSVIRAATMLSFIVVAQMINKRSNIYNTLAASAITIFLIFGPERITETGLQLSFAAVLGIVFFQPRLSGMLKIKNKALKYIWEITCVSIAAQLVTAPITVYQFGIFPVYFMLTNLIAIPGAFIVLSSGLFVYTLELINFGCQYLFGMKSLYSETSEFAVSNICRVFNFEVSWLNKSIHFISELPWATIQNIEISAFTSIMMYALIISAAFWVSHKYKHALFTGFTALTVTLSVWVYDRYFTGQNPELHIHSIPGHSVMGYFGSDREIYSADSNFWADEQKQGYYLGGVISRDRRDTLTEEDRFFVFDDLIIQRIDDEEPFVSSKIPVDVLWLQTDNVSTLNNLDSNESLVVIDGSLSYYERVKISEVCKNKNLNAHDISGNSLQISRGAVFFGEE